MLVVNDNVRKTSELNKSKKSDIEKAKELTFKRNLIIEKLNDPLLSDEDRKLLLIKKFKLDDKLTSKNSMVNKLRSDLRKMYNLEVD